MKEKIPLVDIELISRLIDIELTKEQRIYLDEITRRWMLDKDKIQFLLNKEGG